MSAFHDLLLCDLDYNAWADRRLLRACAMLSGEQFCCDLGASHRSIAQTLTHIFISERFWRDCLLASAVPPLATMIDEAPPTVLSLPELHELWPEVWDSLRGWFLAQPEDALVAEIDCLKPDGTMLPVSARHIIRHSVNHASIHRGQIVTMLRALGFRPPNTDMFGFYLA